MVRITVAITDLNWFQFLRKEPDLQAVNFWNPSGEKLGNLEQGELVLFKLKSPVNKIAGGGIFTNFEKLPWKMAWDSFGRENGAETVKDFHKQLLSNRNNAKTEFFEIGCTIISNPFFLDVDDYLNQPIDWHPNTQRCRIYNTSGEIGMQLWDDVQPVLWRETEDRPERYGPPQLIRPRYGQKSFRSLTLINYNNRCAVTKERTLPVLEAAHIKPYSQGGSHDLSNGILFRSDIHRLFDGGYVTVTPNLKFEVSQKIREDYLNGKDYYALHGKDIFEPTEKNRIPPDTSLLEWHNNNCYNG